MFCQIVIQLVIISLQYIAGGSILHAIMPEVFDFKTGMLVSAITFISITFIGGMWSASLTNVLNIILIYFGIVVATFIQLDKVGGIDTLAKTLPANVPWFSFTEGVGLKTIASWVITLVTVNLSLQSILQISLGAKDAATARKGFVWGGIIMLLSAGTLFSNDIYKRFINPKCSDAKQLTMMRLCIVISGVLTLGMAMGVSSILGTIMIGLSLTAAFSVIVIVALFFPQYSCKAAGFWTLLVGFIMLVLWQFVPAVRIFPNVIYMEWFACILTYAVVAVLQPGKKLAADTAE